MFRKYKEKTVNKFLIAIISFCALFTIISMFISYRFSKIERTMTQMEQDNIYEYYYVMIVNDVKSPFWLSVYESALAEAKEIGRASCRERVYVLV